MQAVFELAIVDPHEPAGRSIPAVEWESYREGYIRALQVALQVMTGAEVRWRLWLKEKRRRLAQARAAAAALTQRRDLHVPENLGVTLDDTADESTETRDFVRREHELDERLPVAVLGAEVEPERASFTVSFPRDIRVDDELFHRDAYRIEAKQKESPIEGAKIVYQAGPPSVTATSYPCSDARQSTAAEATSLPAQKAIAKPRARRRRG